MTEPTSPSNERTLEFRVRIVQRGDLTRKGRPNEEHVYEMLTTRSFFELTNGTSIEVSEIRS